MRSADGALASAGKERKSARILYCYLQVHRLWGRIVVVTKQQIESAVASGLPFTLRMADGREYPVPHPDHISLPPKASYVIVYDDDGHFTVLPLLTMTGLESKVTEAGTKEK